VAGGVFKAQSIIRLRRITTRNVAGGFGRRQRGPEATQDGRTNGSATTTGHARTADHAGSLAVSHHDGRGHVD
jgi:hypothetical protein